MSKDKNGTGYMMVANDIWDAFCKSRFSGEEHQVIDVIMRKTWGFNKQQDHIALSQFVEMTGINKPNLVRAIKKLEDKNVIIVIKNDNRKGNLYSLNKQFTEWKPLSKKIIVIKKDNKPLSKMIHTKDKEQKTKEINKKVCSQEDIEKAVSLWNAEFDSSYKVTEGKRAKLTTRLESFSLEEILQAIRNIAADDWMAGRDPKKTSTWRPTLEWLLKSDEKVDEWLNKDPVEDQTERPDFDITVNPLKVPENHGRN